LEQQKTLTRAKSRITGKLTSNPILREAAEVITRINDFTTSKTSNRLYAGYLNQGLYTKKEIDYPVLIERLNAAFADITSVQDLTSVMHKIFSECFNATFSAFGLYHESSRCLNLTLQNLTGNTYMSKIFTSDAQNPVAQCFNTGLPMSEADNRFLNIPYLQTSPALIVPLRTAGKFIGVAMIGADSSDLNMFSFIANHCALFIENLELTEKTAMYANTDTPTGLLNHRGFQEVLSREIKSAQENKTNLSVIMFDINNISKINRELSHAKGDEVIKLVAQKIKQNIRSGDSAGRYGGDEIAVILPDTNTHDAKYLAEYITYTLSCCFVDDVGPVKVSVGIATYPECTSDQEKLLILAEQATHISQAKGYKNGMSTIVSSLDFNFWDNEALKSFAQVLSKRHSQLGINYEEELLHQFVNQSSPGNVIDMATSLAGAIDAKDPYTKDHSTAVSRYSEALARAINLPEKEVQRITLGALLHDVGKIGVPEHVLHKSTKLTEEEFEIIKQHPEIGALKVLEPNEALRDLIPIVKYHHERVDGKGYPERLSGEHIPLGARIVAVADSFHALISDRPYRKGMSLEKACEILKMGAGTQWDSDLVRHFINIASSLATTV
jgi:diguanylate cyclase (GGDEF)-like protein/putative nucleotidyltransferase with HDIG domain